MDSFTATAMSSGLPSSLGRSAEKCGGSALQALAECRRQREQQEQLLLKAQEELHKAAQLAKTATEPRVGAPASSRVSAPPATIQASKGSVPHVRPALRGALRRQKSDGEALKSEAAKMNGVSASLRAAAALSPHRGFYHGSSPRRPRAQTTSGRLAWADAPAAPMSPVEPEEPEPGPDDQSPEVVEAEAEVVADPELKTEPPSWKRLEKTITQYVSRRTVTSSEYEQVRQRYEGHLHELKTLCETLGRSDRPAPNPGAPSRERGRGALNFRELQDEKDFRDFLELRDPLLGHRAAAVARSACSPRQAPKSKATSPRMRSARKSGERGRVAAEEAETYDVSVVPPLLSARMLSAVPMALLHEDNDLEHVRSLFCAQVPEAQVLNIYRVENPTLAGVYSAVRDAMGSDSELDLWHGTSSECVPNIVLNGFNRAYSGRSHGTKLGHGSYFSASASYSTRFCDRKRHRRTVFFAKVLVGAWAKGSPELVEPPCKDSEGLLRYDCTVDDPESPVNFCIFRDFQAMPTYLLEFVQKEHVRS